MIDKLIDGLAITALTLGLVVLVCALALALLVVMTWVIMALGALL